MNAAGDRVYSIMARGSHTKKRRCSSCLRDCTPQRGHTRLAAPQQRQQHTWLHAPRNGVSGGQEHAAQRSTAAAAQCGISTNGHTKQRRTACASHQSAAMACRAAQMRPHQRPVARQQRHLSAERRTNRQRRVQGTASGAGAASGAERTRAPRLKRLSGGRSSASASGRSRRRPGSSEMPAWQLAGAARDAACCL